jgi:hypothetical protein
MQDINDVLLPSIVREGASVVTHFLVPIKKMKMRKYKKEVEGPSLRPNNIFAYK